MRLPLTPVFLLFFVCLSFQQGKTEENVLYSETTVPDKYIFFFGTLIIFAILHYFILTWQIVVPTAIFAIILGLLWGVGSIYYDWMHNASLINRLAVNYMPEFYLPVILFATAFCSDIRAFLKCLPQILIISIPVGIMALAPTALLMRQVLDWDFAHAFLLGGMFLPIYPMDVVRFLKETSVHTKYVSILLQGEALITISVAMVMFNIIRFYITGFVVHWYQFAMCPIRMIGIGIPLGCFFGKLSTIFMKLTYNDVSELIMLSFIACYLSFYVGDYMGKAGVVTCIITGIMMGKERPTLTKEVEDALLSFWKLLSLLNNCAIYIAIGLLIPPLVYGSQLSVNKYFIVFVTYLMASIWRFCSMFLFSPILSRLGYGISFKGLIVLAWGGIKSPLVTFFVTYVTTILGQSEKTDLLFVHTIGVYILMLLVNASFVPILFKTLGLSDVSVAKQISMGNCMKYIHETRSKVVAILKMDRLLSDANWPLVMNSTNLKHPYQKVYQTKAAEEDEEEDEDFFLRYKFTYCPDCQKHILNEPSKKEMKEMMKEAKLRLLKQKKAVYSRQYENGMISKHASRIFQQAVEVAMDSEELAIELDGLFQLFASEDRLHTFVQKRLQGLVRTRAEILHPPQNKLKLFCYRIVRNLGFCVFMYTVVLLNMIQASTNADVEHDTSIDAEDITNNVIRILFLGTYIAEFCLKIMAYSWLSLKNGFQTYFKLRMNIIEFVILVHLLIYLMAEAILMMVTDFVIKFWYVSLLYNTWLLIRMTQILAYFKIEKLFKKIGNRLLKFLCAEYEKKKALAYELGKNYITGEDEILENLPHMVDNDRIQEQLREKIEQEKLEVTTKLGLLQIEAPWVTSTVKTRMAVRTVLNSLRDDIFELKVSGCGWVDDVECNKLLDALAEKYKTISSIENQEPSSPKLIFKEIPYICENSHIQRYLYSNICTRKFDPGNVVCKEGELVDGICILITGMLKISYTPTKAVIEKLKEMGSMPVVDYLCPTRYEKGMVEYATPGNTLGELSTITNRPCDGTVTAETHSEIYLIKREAIKAAIKMDQDPVSGLECKIWKSISFRKAVTVLMAAPLYRSHTQETILYILERAFLPDLSNYKTFVVSDMIQDILLIEGIVVDFHTRDLYTAPCYIPRAVQKLMLPTNSHLNIEKSVPTQLLVIPAKNIDEYDMMMQEEEMGELVNANSTKCLRHIIEKKAKQTKYRKASRFKRLRQLRRSGAKGSSITFLSSKSAFSRMSSRSTNRSNSSVHF